MDVDDAPPPEEPVVAVANTMNLRVERQAHPAEAFAPKKRKTPAQRQAEVDAKEADKLASLQRLADLDAERKRICDEMEANDRADMAKRRHAAKQRLSEFDNENTSSGEEFEGMDLLDTSQTSEVPIADDFITGDEHIYPEDVPEQVKEVRGQISSDLPFG
jgi:hypothetical protein